MEEKISFAEINEMVNRMGEQATEVLRTEAEAREANSAHTKARTYLDNQRIELTRYMVKHNLLDKSTLDQEYAKRRT